jgi:hypothetical protein
MGKLELGSTGSPELAKFTPFASTTMDTNKNNSNEAEWSHLVS